MRIRKILAVALALCFILSVGAFASSDMPDTSQGGRATSSPPDNSTKAVDILGTRAAFYFEYGENGYTTSRNITDDYEIVTQSEVAAPASGEMNVIDGIYLYCGAEAWDEENEVGNSGIVINDLTDTETTWYIGGDEAYYEAPDGQMYNSVIIMETAEDEELASGATETAPGTGIAFNGKSLELKNVYMYGEGASRPTIHIPASTRDKNVSQLSDLVMVDSMIANGSTRCVLLMGGDVWFLNSRCLTTSWGALSYDNTSTTMYVVNSDVENVGARGYAIYDAAGCTAYVYGSRVLGWNTALVVCRTAELTVDSLENASDVAVAPYDGSGDLTVPAYTADGRAFIAAFENPIKLHADMAGPDTQAAAYLNNAYISSRVEDLEYADGSSYTDALTEASGISGLISDCNRGDLVYLASHSGKVVFDNCELASRSGVLVHSMFAYDSMASGIYPEDGAEYIGDEVVIRNMSAEGDILHEDYMRKMELSLENAELTGRVVGTTLTGWNSYWIDAVSKLPADELSEASDEMTPEETTLKQVIYNDTYDTVWGVRMSMDADSVWNVTGDSNLYSFTMEDGALVKAADGQSITIYVDCAMDNGLEAYDISTGRQIAAFEPGVEYSGVVIVVSGAASGESSSEPSAEAPSAEPAVSADAGVPMNLPDGSMPPEPPADLAPGEEPPGGFGGID